MSALAKVRSICLALPGAHEVLAWGEPTFRVNNKLFAMYASPNTHHTDGRPAIWVKSTPVNQSLMVQAKPKRFFMPPYVGTSGWVGVRLDGRVPWKEVAEILKDAYELAAVRKPRAWKRTTRRSTRTTR
jgi:predicted DNA-binding protein (MmcQ/YjbR family)